MKIEEALALFKNKSGIARALGISRQAVSKWSEIPIRRSYELKEIIKKSTNNNETKKCK